MLCTINLYAYTPLPPVASALNVILSFTTVLVLLAVALTANTLLLAVVLILIAEHLTTLPVASFTSTNISLFPTLPAVHVNVLSALKSLSLNHSLVSKLWIINLYVYFPLPPLAAALTVTLSPATVVVLSAVALIESASALAATLTLITLLLTTLPVTSFTSTNISLFPALPAVHVSVLLALKS